MPLLARPDGVQLYWEQAGDGPGVLICNTFNLAPLDGLVERLASSRRVVAYEPRGARPLEPAGPVRPGDRRRGRRGAARGDGPGGGRPRHRRRHPPRDALADARPDLVDRVVFTSSALGRESGERSGFAASTEVLYALMSLIRRDYRSGLRQMLAGSAKDEDRGARAAGGAGRGDPAGGRDRLPGGVDRSRVLRRRAPAGRAGSRRWPIRGTRGSRSRCTRGCATT